jgi:hypothetical protein
MDDGLGGGYITIAGGDKNTHLATSCIISSREEDGGYSFNVRRGLIYRIRYRARNIVGWSEYSAVAYIKAARKPDAPQPITVTASDSTSITLSIGPSLDNGGSSLLSYTLYQDDGSLSSNYLPVFTGMF